MALDGVAVDHKHSEITSATLSVLESIISPSILGKDSTIAGTETSTWYSTSPHHGDEVDPRYFRCVGG